MEKKSSWLANSAFRGKAILVIAATLLMQYVASCFAADSYNVLTVYLPEQYGIAATQLANAYTIGGLVCIPFGILAGYLITKKGAIRVGAVFLVVLGLAQIMFAQLGTNVVFTTIAWILSKCFGWSLAYVSAALTANWFIQYRGRILGLNTIGGPLETATGVALLTWGCTKFGFGASYTVGGIVCIVLGVVLFFILKDTPEAYGLHPDGAPEATEREIAMANEENPWNIKKIFTTKDAVLLNVGMTICNFAMFCMMMFFVARFLASGMEMTVVVSAMSIGGLCAIPVSYAYGWIDDKFGTQKACVVFAAVLLISMFGLAYGDRSSALLVLCGFGVASATGGLPNLHPSISAHVFGQKNFMYCHKYTSALTSVFTAFCAKFMAEFAAHAEKAGLSAVDGYVKAYWVLAAALVVAIVCFALIGKSYDQKLSEKGE